MLDQYEHGRSVRRHRPTQAAFAVCHAAYLSPFCRFLPENLSILGYARSKLSKKDLQEKVKPNLKGDDDKVNEFLDKLDYEAGPYDKPEGYQKVSSAHSSA